MLLHLFKNSRLITKRKIYKRHITIREKNDLTESIVLYKSSKLYVILCAIVVAERKVVVLSVLKTFYGAPVILCGSRNF